MADKMNALGRGGNSRGFSDRGRFIKRRPGAHGPLRLQPGGTQTLAVQTPEQQSEPVMHDCPFKTLGPAVTQHT
jgi:hypothetical protein